MNKTKLFCNMLFIGVLSGVGFAQTKEADSLKVEKLDEVFISDSKFELQKENSGKVITKITAKDLEQLKGQSVAQIVSRTAGVEINGVYSNAGQNLSYFVRGGRNRQVVILIDGVQVTDPSQIANDYDLRLLNADQVESIEILKGASSTLYGTGAATAVINIKLKKAKDDPFNVNVASVIGTNQTAKEDDELKFTDYRNNVTVNGTISKLSYFATYGMQYTDGLSAVEDGEESDIFKSHNGLLKLGYAFSDDFKVNTFVSFDDINVNFDDSFGRLDANFQTDSKQYRVGFSPEFKYKKGSITLNAIYNDVERDTQSSFPSKFNAQSFVADLFNRYNFNDTFYTVLGVNFQDNKMESFSIPFGATDFAQAINPDEASFNIIDPYLNVVYTSDFGLNLNAGIRLNNHSEYGSHLVYNVNPSYTKNTSFGYVKGLISYSTAFITPSLFQLFEPSFGNLDLEPEENQTFELGTEVKINDLGTFSLVYFKRWEENFIDFVDTGDFVFQYLNINDEFETDGLEFVAQVRLLEDLNLNVNATYTNVDDDLNLRIPEYKINTKLDYNINDSTLLSLSYQYNDDRTDSVFNNVTFQNDIVDLQSFHILDFYISRKIWNNKLTVFANVTNILNEEYQELFGFETRGRGVNFGFNLDL